MLKTKLFVGLPLLLALSVSGFARARGARAARYRTDAERGVEEGGHGTGAFAATAGGFARRVAEVSQAAGL
jgi:hypothetical protein